MRCTQVFADTLKITLNTHAEHMRGEKHKHGNQDAEDHKNCSAKFDRSHICW